MATTTQTKVEIQNFIDGQERNPAAGKTEEVVNPATGEPIAVAPLSDEQDVDAAVKAAGRSSRVGLRLRRVNGRWRSSRLPTRSRLRPKSSPASSP